MFTDVAYILLFFFLTTCAYCRRKGLLLHLLTINQSISHTHTHTHTHTHQDSPGRGIGSKQSLLPDNTTLKKLTSIPSSSFKPAIPERQVAAPYIAWPPGSAVYEIQKRKISSTCSVAGCLLHDRHAVCSVASFSSCVPGRMFKRIDSNTSSHRSLKFSHSDYQLLQTATARFADINMNKYTNFKFHCFTVHFDTLRFIHTNSCNFSYNYVSVF